MKRGFRCLFVTISVLFASVIFMCNLSYGATYYVDPDNEHSGDGSEGNPWKTIAEALSYVTDGDTVYLAGGTYSSTTNGEIMPIIINRDVTLIGHTSDSERSIIDADGSMAIECNSQNITLRNLEIKNGRAINGGGLYCGHTGASITIDNCFIHNNTAHFGSGIYTAWTSLTIINSTISNNGDSLSSKGGGIYSFLDGSNNLTISDSIFDSNKSSGLGGGIYIETGTFNESEPEIDAVITNCIFTNNQSADGGGAIGVEIYGIREKLSRARLDITKSKFYRNESINGHGGAINALHQKIVNISNCLFVGNEAACNGGALYTSCRETIPSKVTVINCTMHNNKARADNDSSRAYYGDAICVGTYINLYAVNNIFSEYRGTEGTIGCEGWRGRDEDGEPLPRTAQIKAIANCDFFGEGPIYKIGSDIYNNVAELEAGANGVTCVENNREEDPEYSSIGDGNFRLLPTSPCIDRATDEFDFDGDGNPDIDIALVNDLDGNPRPYNLRYDIGAYECQDDIPHDNGYTPILKIDKEKAAFLIDCLETRPILKKKFILLLKHRLRRLQARLEGY